MRIANLNMHLRLGKSNYLLYSKEKYDNRPWKLILHYSLPPELIQFELGKLPVKNIQGVKRIRSDSPDITFESEDDKLNNDNRHALISEIGEQKMKGIDLENVEND